MLLFSLILTHFLGGESDIFPNLHIQQLNAKVVQQLLAKITMTFALDIHLFVGVGCDKID